MWDSMLLHKNCVNMDRGLIVLDSCNKRTVSSCIVQISGKEMPMEF